MRPPDCSQHMLAFTFIPAAISVSDVVPPLRGSTNAVPFGVGATLADFDKNIAGIIKEFTYKDPKTG